MNFKIFRIWTFKMVFYPTESAQFATLRECYFIFMVFAALARSLRVLPAAEQISMFSVLGGCRAVCPKVMPNSLSSSSTISGSSVQKRFAFSVIALLSSMDTVSPILLPWNCISKAPESERLMCMHVWLKSPEPKMNYRIFC